MTTWEKATPADLQTLSTLITKAQNAGLTPPITHAQLPNLTKREAGKLLTSLRELLSEPHP